MATLQHAFDLIAYNDWANSRLLGCCAELTHEQWTVELGGSFPSLRSVLAHLIAAEWIWLERWQGRSPSGPPAWMETPDPATLKQALALVETDRTAFLRSLSAADLDADVHYTLLSGTSGVQPLSTLLLHTVNHSTYYRGQAAAMLRRLGVVPPSTDLIEHAAERCRIREA